jgi:DNA-binding HxlR family transcriptional regulator
VLSMNQQVKEQFLLLLLYGIEQGLSLSQISKNLNKSKQALNYHLKKMKALNLISVKVSYPFAIYNLTDLGKAVKKILVHNEKSSESLFRVHNGIIGFDVVKFGNYRFIDTTARKIISMNNWNYAVEKQEDFIINIQDTGLLKITCPIKFSSYPDQSIAENIAECSRIAQEFCDKYDMKLKSLRIIRRFQKELLHSSELAAIFGHYKNIEKLWIDKSGGTDNLEEYDSSHAIEDILSLPKAIESLKISLDGGINTLAYLMTQQNEIIKKALEKDNHS